jgi:uncharacterized protein
MKVFSTFADWLIFTILKAAPETQFGNALHFFVEDVVKIYTLLIIMIYLIALLRAGINTERIREFLKGKRRGIGYVSGSVFGAITPFCSCSSIPLFLGFTSAGIPLGITMAFLITSPMINEVAIILLGTILGVRFLTLYIITGLSAGILGGFFLDAIHAERFLTKISSTALAMGKPSDPNSTTDEKPRLTLSDRHNFARDELKEIFRRVWKWVLIGVGLGAALHGFVPESFIVDKLGDGQWWSVPAAVLLGIPLYANASGIIPVIETLLSKGLPVGTSMAFMMSVVAASFPEFIMLKQVMKPKLLIIFFLMLLFFFTLAGWIFNFLY